MRSSRRPRRPMREPRSRCSRSRLCLAPPDVTCALRKCPDTVAMHSEGVIFHSGEPEPAPRDIEFDWRLLGWCVVLGLVGAAGWALVELLSGRLDYDDAR